MKESKFCYIVAESGRERHEGEFFSTFFISDNFDLAIERYNKEKIKLFEEEYFFLKDELENGDYMEHFVISSSGKSLPVFSIETKWENYELYISEMEMNKDYGE